MYFASVGTYLSYLRMVVALKANVHNAAMGILMICPIDRGHRGARFGLPYFSISLSLNVLLTLMITVRLILHGRKIRAMTGSQVGISGLYNSIATILIESSALYAVSSLLVIGPLAADSPVVDLFTPILAETQVRTSSRLDPRMGCPM